LPEGFRRAIVAGVALLTPLGLDEARALGRAYGVAIDGIEALELGSVNSNFRVRTGDGRVLFGRLYEPTGYAISAAGSFVAFMLSLRAFYHLEYRLIERMT
jgi:hypothetical protein